MKVSYRKPHIKIADHVQEILVLENHWSGTPFTLPLFANGMPTLLFHTTKGKFKSSLNNLTLFGQTVSPATLTINDNFILIAYFLKPFSLTSLFSFAAIELTDNPVDLDLCSPVKVATLQEQLLNSASVEAMMSLLDEYIFKLITLSKDNSSVIKYSTNRIAQNPGHKILRELQAELCVTERSFQRMFEKNVGLSPNLFRRVCQFNRAFQQLNRQRHTSLADITFNNGFADQSHFIRTFREFTNVTPTEYLNYGTPPA